MPPTGRPAHHSELSEMDGRMVLRADLLAVTDQYSRFRSPSEARRVQCVLCARGTRPKHERDKRHARRYGA